MSIENQEISADRSAHPQGLRLLESDNEIQHLLEASLPSRQASLCDIVPHNIEPNPFQPRKHFDEQALQELAISLRTYGVLSRIRVRPHPNRDGIFQLVYGERRLRASRLAGLLTIPCEVAPYTDEELKDISLIENIQRQDLTPLEEATMFRQLLDEKDSPYSIRKLAQKIGKDKSYVEIRLALLNLPEDVRQLLVEGPKVSLRALIEVAKLPLPEAREPLIEQLRTGMLSTEAIRAIVREILDRLKKSTPQIAVDETDPHIFQRTFYKASRRLEAALNEFRKATDIYAGAPDPAKKEKLSEYLHRLQEEAEYIKELLS